jgi:hypothetical protein
MRVVPQPVTACHAEARPGADKACDTRDRGKPKQAPRGRGTQIVAKCLSARLQLSRGVQMARAAQEYRNKAATCLRLSKTMDDNNRRRLEGIARRWLELAREDELDEQGYLEAAG